MTTPVASSETIYVLTGNAVGPFSTGVVGQGGWGFANASEVTVFVESDSVEAQVASNLFTVAGVNTLASGGTVTLSASLVPDDGWGDGVSGTINRLILRRATGLNQNVSFPDTQGFTPTVTEGAFDKAVRQVQDLWTKVSRGLFTVAGEVLNPLPPADSRANMYLKFDGYGQPTLGDAQGAKGDPGGNVMSVGPRAAMGGIAVPTGTNTIITSGFVAFGDHGHGLYKRVASDPYPGDALNPAKFRSADRYLPGGDVDLANGGWWLNIDYPINPRAFGVTLDGVTDDTVAWQYVFAQNRWIASPAGVTLVSAQLVNGPFHLEGPMTNGNDTNDDRLVMVCTKPGITPLASPYEIACYGVSFRYASTGLTPAGNLTYAQAYKVTASITTVGSDVFLNVPAGGLLANASVGSAVQIIADGTKDFDYYPNNYTDITSFAVIKQIVSDTQAKLFMKTGSAVASQSMYIRGTPVASVWAGTYQPTRVTLENVRFKTCPGFGIVLTGAQQVDIHRVFGGGHVHTVGAFPNAGQDPLTVGGVYHHARLHSIMNLELSGGVVMSSGLLDSHIDQCQHDPIPDAGGPNIPTYFTSPVAPYAIYASFSMLFEGNSSEDCSSPSSALFYACFQCDVNSFHGHNNANALILYQACGQMIDRGLRVTGTGSGVLRAFAGAGAAATNELLVIEGGRDGAGHYVYRNGVFGDFERFIDRRDIEIVRVTIPAATLLVQMGTAYTYDIAPAVLDGHSDVDATSIERVYVNHVGAWTATSGTPNFSFGTPTTPTRFLNSLSLNQAAGFYMDAANISITPACTVAGAAGTAGLRITVSTGGLVNFNSGNVTVPGDMIVYVFLRRMRTTT